MDEVISFRTECSRLSLLVYCPAVGLCVYYTDIYYTDIITQTLGYSLFLTSFSCISKLFVDRLTVPETDLVVEKSIPQFNCAAFCNTQQNFTIATVGSLSCLPYDCYQVYRRNQAASSVSASRHWVRVTAAVSTLLELSASIRQAESPKEH